MRYRKGWIYVIIGIETYDFLIGSVDAILFISENLKSIDKIIIGEEQLR